MKDILIISPFDVTVNNGNLQRLQQILTYYSADNNISLMSLSMNSFDEVSHWLINNKINAKVVSGISVIIAKVFLKVWYLSNYLFCIKLRWYENFKFPLKVNVFGDILLRYDDVFVLYEWCYLLFKMDKWGEKVVVDLNDVMSNRHKRIEKRVWISIDLEDEKRVVCGKCRPYAITPNDSIEFDMLFSRKIPVLPFLPVDYLSLSKVSRVDENSIGFMGSANFHNKAIVTYLLSEKFCAFLKREKAVLRIAGGISEYAQTKYHDCGDEVFVMGKISSLSDFYATVKCVINPVGPSTGVKIKSVEALISGKLLITTKYGIDDLLLDCFSEQIYIISWPLDELEMFSVISMALMIHAEEHYSDNNDRYLKLVNKSLSNVV